MFCEKCSREIVHDSAYCSYCGQKVEEPQEDWNEEERDAHASGPAECIKPHMPKKHCTDCGKELPGSTISNVCAICTIRRRNRDEMQRRKDAKLDTKRDRYDISDEFDQSVFARRNTSSYREPTEPEFRRARPAKTQYFDTGAEEKKEAQKKKGSKIAMLLISGFVLYFVVTTALNLIFRYGDFSGSSAVKESNEVVVSEVSSSEWEFESESEMELDTADEDTTVRTLSDLSELTDMVAQEILQQNLEASAVIPSHDRMTWDGAYIYANGLVVYKEGDYPKTAQYEVCIMLTQMQYLPVQVLVGEETLFDNRDYIDTTGHVTEEGAEFFGVSAGSLLFGEDPLLYPEDFVETPAFEEEIQSV